MRDAAPTTIFLKDYTPFGFIIDGVELTFRLAPKATRVLSRIKFRPNPDATDKRFFLHGESLTRISAAIDGKSADVRDVDGGIEADVPDAPFVWEAEVEINPQDNTALEGLYMSNGMYCTQCEAEGFRKITYYPDRPDVMAAFEVTIEGNEKVLLSNGNPLSQSQGFAKWQDPWPKPAYLFALVAGDLLNHPGTFTTKSGRQVDLNIWVRPGDENKCAFGMQALKDSMKWDEDVYGREYDLDLFNIVAVDDFNMGAMENKGLNVFNSSCVLASPETSTDGNFERIEAIIAHEYFHNWTGNRITCRDWFQLCLKEGLTVYRDQQFTADLRSAPVARISNVLALRGRQFPEDQGPLSHPVRPKSFQEINNFYTATVYEKGAEVIGMLKTLVGDAAYSKAVDLYFDRHDGDAATIEDWLQVFEDSTGRDLGQFKRWYSHSGTPRLTVREEYDGDTFTLHLSQSTAPTPGQDEKLPQVIPVAVGLLSPNGDEVMATQILELTEAEQSFRFEGHATRPIPSILRDFSAPVILEQDIDKTRRAFLLAHDTDPFNRWEAGRMLARESLLASITTGAAPDAAYLEGLGAVLRDDTLDAAYRALMLGQPTQSELAGLLHEAGITPDPEAIHTASEDLRNAKAAAFGDLLPVLYQDNQIDGPYSPDADGSGKRSLANAALSLISRTDGGALAAEQYAKADNMTLQLAALSCLLDAGAGKEQLAAFEQQWHGDRLVMDKWFSLQIMQAKPDQVAEVTTRLTQHPDFDMKNPNRFRAVMGALSMHHAGFHHKSGAAYALLAEWLIKLDPVNPQTTARMCSAFQTWKRYDPARQTMMSAELDRIANTKDLSRDTNEMITRIRSA
ncbi:aminopeptidase N [Shimia thalassica]|uniref:aminopeptidase N n=1 Tax=Shimia thalassica TaxID=1715693 RepID=UPI001C08497B|nr:aminopeptidase N [Shimia thalassica]MBU2944463.1 aminopeptidase N [Shimia thalassica]MDO6502191.1 aminopeptidase N [Shimia thalassica]